MKARLLAPHVIADAYRERGEIIESFPLGYIMTPMMEGLDDEAKAAIAQAHIRTFGRHPGVPYGFPTASPLLDSPPIQRPLDDNQPVFHFQGVKEYIS